MSPEAVHGGDVYRNRVRLDFSVNLNPLSVPPEITEAAAAGLAEMRQYPDPVQMRLRESIASYEGVSPDNVICGNGASELIMAVCHAVKPRKALITAPCYAGYERALRAAGAEIEEYPLDAGSDFALNDELTGALTDDVDIVFIADPNNPNGRLIDEAVMRRITGTCEERGITLVIDECFLPLTDRGLATGASGDRALHLRAFTKTFAIPGIRIGYIVSRDRGMLASISEQLPEWNVSRIAERTGEAAARVLRETGYLTESVKLISREREYLKRELEGMSIRVFESDTNYLLLKSRPDLYGRLLEKGILIRKCANFSGLDDTYFRIAVRTREDNEEFLKALAEVK